MSAVVMHCMMVVTLFEDIEPCCYDIRSVLKYGIDRVSSLELARLVCYQDVTPWALSS